MNAETLACALKTARAARNALEARAERDKDTPRAEDLRILAGAAQRIVRNLTQLLVTAERRTP